MTQNEIAAVVRRHTYRLKFCYEQAVRLQPAALRRVHMKVTIHMAATGRVTSVSISPGRFQGMSLGSCMVSAIKRWKFPPSTRSYRTRFPLKFIGR